MKKSWHKYNADNSTPNLVAPTIDASDEEEPCRPHPQDVSKYRETQNNGVESIPFQKWKGKPDGGASSPKRLVWLIENFKV